MEHKGTTEVSTSAASPKQETASARQDDIQGVDAEFSQPHQPSQVLHSRLSAFAETLAELA